MVAPMVPAPTRQAKGPMNERGGDIPPAHREVIRRLANKMDVQLSGYDALHAGGHENGNCFHTCVATATGTDHWDVRWLIKEAARGALAYNGDIDLVRRDEGLTTRCTLRRLIIEATPNRVMTEARRVKTWRKGIGRNKAFSDLPTWALASMVFDCPIVLHGNRRDPLVIDLSGAGNPPIVLALADEHVKLHLGAVWILHHTIDDTHVAFKSQRLTEDGEALATIHRVLHPS